MTTNMNTIDTSFNTVSSYSNDSTPVSSPRNNSRFEIYFDQANYNKQNSPINARLMYYKYPRSLPSKENQYLFSNYSEQSSPVSSPRISTVPVNSQYPNTQQLQQEKRSQSSNIPPLLRSVSLPSMNKQASTSASTDDIADQPTPTSPTHSHCHSRKSSILSNCTHISSNTRDRSNSCVSCQNSIITINDDENTGEEGDVCKRHHHRRESVAIKFTNPKIIDDGEGEGAVQESEVFEQLKNYEMR